MKLNKRHKIILTSLMCMLLNTSIAYTQDRIITMEKGQKALTAVSSATQFKWSVDGKPMPETSGTLSLEWDTGTYLVAATPIDNNCTGDSFLVKLNVIDTITKIGGQISFVSKEVEVCPTSDAVPISGLVDVGISFTNYNLPPGESYSVKYTMDDGPPITSLPFKTKDAVININTLGLSQGEHKLKITRLMYGPGFINQVDYTTSKLIPTMIIKVKLIPDIGEINF